MTSSTAAQTQLQSHATSDKQISTRGRPRPDPGPTSNRKTIPEKQAEHPPPPFVCTCPDYQENHVAGSIKQIIPPPRSTSTISIHQNRFQRIALLRIRTGAQRHRNCPTTEGLLGTWGWFQFFQIPHFNIFRSPGGYRSGSSILH